MSCRIIASIALALLFTGCAPAEEAPEVGSFANIDRLPEPAVTDSARNLQVPVIGELPAITVYDFLMATGDLEDADAVRLAVLERGEDVEFAALALAAPKAYQYTDHVFGYIAPPAGASAVELPIVDAHSITADQTLKNARLRLTLDRLRVFEYPGRGVHHVLFDFSAHHQATNTEKETPHFNHVYRVQQGGQAGITGYPIFVGLRAGSEGIHFKASTVNVKNTGDQRFLGFLESDIFKGGLTLLTALNPAVPVVSNFATGVAKGIADQNNNRPVQDVYMGLDFETVPSRPKLRVGSYIAIQVPDAASWNWAEWRYSFRSGQVVSAADNNSPVPFNYFVIGISRM